MMVAFLIPVRTLVLTLSALPDNVAEMVRAEGGCEPEIVILERIPRNERLNFLRRLMSTRADLLIVMAEDASLAGIVQGISGLVRALRRMRIAEGRLQAFGWGDIARGVFQTLGAALASWMAVMACRWQLRALEKSPWSGGVPGTGPVLYINPTLWRGRTLGGSIAHTRGVLKGFLAHGYRVDVLATLDDGIVPLGLKHHPLPPAPPFGIPAEANLFRHQMSVAKAVRKLTDANSYGFVYQRLTLGTYPGVLAARRQGIPLVVEYNGSEVWIARNWGTGLRFQSLAERAEKACLSHADLVVAVSTPLRDQLIELGVSPDRIIVQPNGVDLDEFSIDRFTPDDRQRVRRKLGLDADSLVFGFLGTFGRWHGAAVLAEAFRRLVDEGAASIGKRKAHLLFIGDGIHRADAEAILPADRYGEFRTFAGLVPQNLAPDYLSVCDVLISPHVPNADGSKFFGSPTKLFEYMAMGVPIIASDLDQIGDILAGSLKFPNVEIHEPPPPEACALLVTPGDVDNLRRALQFAAEHLDWMQVLGQNARRKAGGNFSWNRHVEVILTALSRRFPGRVFPINSVRNISHHASNSSEQ